MSSSASWSGCTSLAFSWAELNGTSNESELGLSSLCVSNRLKAAFFVMPLLCFSAMSVFCAVLLAKSFYKHHRWTWRKRAYAFVLVSSLSEALIPVLLMAGVTHRARYILYPIFFICIFSVGSELLLAWAGSIPETDWRLIGFHLKQSLKSGVMFSSAIIVASMLLLFGILPMAFADNPVSLNWTFSVAISSVGLTTVYFCICLLGANRKLRKICQPSADIPAEIQGASKLQAVAQWLDKTKWPILLMIPLPFIEVQAPLWMRLTVDMANGDPGMPGQFYVFFVFGFFLKLFCNATALWVVQKVKESRGTSSGGNETDPSRNTHSHSVGASDHHPKSPRFSMNLQSKRNTSSSGNLNMGPSSDRNSTSSPFSYSIEELNGATAPSSPEGLLALELPVRSSSVSETV